jgi:hypothetical protein
MAAELARMKAGGGSLPHFLRAVSNADPQPQSVDVIHSDVHPRPARPRCESAGRSPG